MGSEWAERWNRVLKMIEVIEDEEALSERIEQLVNTQTTQILAFVNAHALNQVVNQSEFYESLVQADVIFRDGSGIEMLFKSNGMNPGLNLNGTDLIPRILKQSRNKKIALYGTQEPYLGNAKNTIEQWLDGDAVLSELDGFLDFSDYIQAAKESKPNVILLAMGMPKQELLASRLKVELEHPCLIICGGAVLDFIGGKVSRAPKWMRDLGIEWLYRLAIEPKRLFKRYVIGNPLFLYRMNKLIIKKAF